MKAMWFYRIGNKCYNLNIPIIPTLCNALIRLLFNTVLYSDTKIGKGTILAYGGIAVVIHKKAIIGNNVTISQCVTIGGKSGHPDLPIIEDNVYIGAGAKILGPIKIGKGAIIGANAVVIKNVQEANIVVGIPAKVISSEIKK